MSEEPHITAEQLDLYFLDGSARKERDRVDAHVSVCPACADRLRRFAASEERLHEVASAWPEFHAETGKLARPRRVPSMEDRSVPTRLRHWWSRGWPAIPALAGAMAVVLTWLGPTAPALPPYDMEVRGGEQPSRSTAIVTDDERVLTRGSRLEILLRPEIASDTNPQVVVSLDGETRIETMHVKIGPSGAVALSGAIGAQIPLPVAGTHRLIVALGPEEALIDDMVTAGEAGAPWQVFQVSFVVPQPASVDLEASP